MLIQSHGKAIHLPIDKLLYITTDKKVEHLLHFVTKDRTYPCYGSLKTYEKQTTHHLFRCHRSTLVNLKMIQEIDMKNNQIHFIDSEDKCYIYSRRKQKELLIQWRDSIY